MANNFDAAAFAVKCAFPDNKLIMDDTDQPSLHVWIPAFRLCDVLSTESTDIHPAFRINGKQIAGFWMGKYQSKVYNGRSYSLPAGNNNYGKDTTETEYVGIPAPGVQDGGKTARILTGTGPVTYSHNGKMSGVFDMNGNIWEWLLGLRLYKGELQIIMDNNAADNSVSYAASGSAWKAIKASDGSLIAPDGNGTTEGSIKLNVVGGKAVWDTTIADQKDEGRGCSFKDITAGSAVGDAAKLLLMSLALMPDTALTGDGIDATYGNDYFWFNNGAEGRCPIRGGSWSSGTHAGLFYLDLISPRSSVAWSLGGRCAYAELPAES